MPALSEIKDLTDLDPELEMSLASGNPENSQDTQINKDLDNGDFELDQQVDGVEEETVEPPPESAPSIVDE